ncbi:hypothetical protein [Glycomyces buryatensis]|uniref:DUF3618 domain-containing protein n=1 Tax=Glycomyces buryatensis TaxID=2570927 RepID=A0A4S8QFX5_9ACTN|nr:hypothetical protein [Glycomyces buryatensis]THV39544.1 hypothetical protein FAB82_18265 [Glycomyces buryatensis]
MSGWTVPPAGAVPPGVGIGPVPGVAMPVSPERDDNRELDDTQAEWAQQDREAAEYESSHDLRQDAERTRERVNQDVLELRHKLHLDDETKARRAAATGPFGPVKRHPITVMVAAAGATTAALIGYRAARNHRKTAKRSAIRYMKAAKARRKALQHHIGESGHAIAGSMHKR